MDELENLIVKGLIHKQVAKHIQEREPLAAINFVWPKLLRSRDDPELNMLLGVSYFHYGHNENAKLHLSNALKLDPSNYHARYFMAGALAKDGFYDAALEHLNELLNIGHEKTEVYERISELKKIIEK